MFSKNDPGVKLRQLLREQQRNERKMNKKLSSRMKSKYTAENLKLAKNMMLEQAMTIDAEEYEQITAELRERLNNKNGSIKGSVR